jgi:hypothetical protein
MWVWYYGRCVQKRKNINMAYLSTGDKIGLSGLLIALIAIIISLTTPEIRELMGLENDNSNKDDLTGKRIEKEIAYIGKWDSSKVASIVLKELSQAKNENEIKKGHFQEKDKLEHMIIDYYDYYKFGDTNFSKIVIAYSRPENNDHHSRGFVLSFVQFIKDKSGWRLGEKYIAAIYDGSWDEPPGQESIGLLSIGNNILGIMIEGRSTNQGYNSIYKSIYANVEGEFKEVLDYVSSVDDSGSVKPGLDNWGSSLEPQKTGAPFYDLVLFRTGIEDGKKISEKILYKYKRDKYEPVTGF